MCKGVYRVSAQCQEGLRAPARKNSSLPLSLAPYKGGRKKIEGNSPLLNPPPKHRRGEIRVGYPYQLRGLSHAYAHEGSKRVVWRLNSHRLEAVFTSFGGFKRIEFRLKTDRAQVLNGLGGRKQTARIWGRKPPKAARDVPKSSRACPQKQQGMSRKAAKKIGKNRPKSERIDKNVQESEISF